MSPEQKRKMMTYGKTKGIVLLEKYLPDLTPIKDVKIISDIQEWDKIKDECPDRITCRTDTKIGDQKNVRIEGASGKKEEVPNILKQIKQQNPDGVLLLMQMKDSPIKRYENDGGFNILFNVNESVIIELVGEGFDARELTREKAVHERYSIPWNDVLFMRNKHDLIKSRNVGKYVVNDEEYKRTRKERIEFLNSIESDAKAIEKAVPQEYQQSSDELIQSILDEVVFSLYKRKRELYEDGLKHCNIQGNIVDGKIVPWEIFRPERLISKSKEEER